MITINTFGDEVHELSANVDGEPQPSSSLADHWQWGRFDCQESQAAVFKVSLMFPDKTYWTWAMIKKKAKNNKA